MNSAIFKIMSAAGGNFNAVNYNEKKVKQGVAGLVFFENFGSLQDKKEITKEEFKKYLQAYSSRNNKIKNPVFHATCSCKERELSHEQLKDIALEIMQSLGYKENPVLIYEHHDTKNNHIHIVTSRVGEDGKKIKDNFEGKRANQFLNAILTREPHQEFNLLLNNALSYKFGTQAQFVLLMEMNGYRIQKKNGNLLFFKHGEKQGEISLIDIDKRIKLVENERRNTDQIKAIIHKYKNQYSGKLHSNHDHKFTTEQKKFESDLTDFLKQKFGMDFIFFIGKDKDKPYGYMIIDHHNREVYKGSDVLKLDYLINDSVVKEQ
ncbi:MAG TPA: relaxase/mobilization nuclease domain-containing protein, partial [Hanamia sp.]|nr:relaxase/mobilization nuclease domain-containing protein [Hanamia sp.]